MGQNLAIVMFRAVVAVMQGSSHVGLPGNLNEDVRDEMVRGTRFRSLFEMHKALIPTEHKTLQKFAVFHLLNDEGRDLLLQKEPVGTNVVLERLMEANAEILQVQIRFWRQFRFCFDVVCANILMRRRRTNHRGSHAGIGNLVLGRAGSCATIRGR